VVWPISLFVDSALGVAADQVETHCAYTAVQDDACLQAQISIHHSSMNLLVFPASQTIELELSQEDSFRCSFPQNRWKQW
jgi:hypothetical protein